VIAAADGAPEAWVDGEPAGVSISISHRGGRALVTVGNQPLIAGCDLELIEPRSDAFLRQWLTITEQRFVSAQPPGQRPLLANMIWSAKEAAAKVRREGLRLDIRGAAVTADLASGCSGWCELQVAWAGSEHATYGWWRSDPGWVMVVACEPAARAPRSIGIEGS
jgi:4'-phosphopantetheinyl transferase